MKKALVTGGAGFIGSTIVQELLKKNVEVLVVDDLSAGQKERVPAHVPLHVIDIQDTKSLIKVCAGVDTIFHLAAIPSVPYSIDHQIHTNEVNVDGTLSVLVAAKEAGVRRVVFSSSCAVYGNPSEIPTSEEAPIDPLSPYAAQKYIGEVYMRLFAQLYNIETVSLRYFNVYGPGMNLEGAYANVIGIFLKQRSSGTPLTVVGDGMQCRDFVHVSDIAAANILAATADTLGGGEVVNIGSGSELSVMDVAKMVGGEVSHLPARKEPMRSCANSHKAHELLGWHPSKPPQEGVLEFIQNYDN